MSWQIRVATLDDLPGIETLWNDAGLHVYPETPLHEEMEAVLARNPDGFLLATDATGIVGSVIGTFDGRRGWIYKLATRTDRRGLGIARALMERIQQTLAAQGCRKVNLLVDGDNTAVISFYEILGFTPQDDVLLSRFLPRSGAGS